MIKVKKGQDPYSVIGQYIRDHVSAIEDMIAVIEIDGKTSNELFMVDMTVDGYFIWKSDWYEGGENVVLIDFFPVSDACNPKDHWIPVTERLPEERDWYLGIFKEPDTGWINPLPFICDYLLGKKTKATTKEGWILRDCTDREEHINYYFNLECVAWMPLPESWKGEAE